MNKLHKHQKGFAAFEAILILIILILIGAVGWMVYKNHHKSATPTSHKTSTSTKSNTSGNTSTVGSTAPPKPSNSSLVLQRQQHVDNYITANTPQNYTAAYYTPLHNDSYISASLYNTIQAGASGYTTGPAYSANPAYIALICVNQTPIKYTYGTVTFNSDASKAALHVNVYVPGSNTPSPFTANWIKANGVWQLNTATCSQN